MLLMTLLVPWAAAQQALPYSYGFEDNDLSTDGWTTQNPSGLNASEFGIIGTAAHSGSYGFRFSSYNDNGASTQYLISPELSAPKGVVVQFYYKASSSYTSGETFQVGYSTTTADISSFTFGSTNNATNTSWAQTDEYVFPAGTKYVAVYYSPNYQYRLYVDDFTFVAPPSCAKPTDLAATLTPGDGTKATLNWTAGGTETAWVLEYGTASDFTGATSVNVSGTPTKNLSGLTAEATYYARVKADCGGEVSDWSSTCVFTPTNDLSITVADGTATNSTIPLDSYSSDTQGSTGEFIIPASNLTSISGSDITEITFYPVSGYAWNSTFQVYVKEVEGTTLDDVYGPDACTVVYTGSLDGSGAKMTITLNDAYTYGGGNLLIGTYIQSAGNYYGSASFYGIEATGAAYASGTYSGVNDGVKNFIAKTTLKYDPPASCPKPTGLTYSDLANRSVKLSWTEKGEATSWQISVNGDETNLITANTNTNFLLDNLEPETEYTVKVRAYCDPKDQSEWSTPVSFTTLVACEAPTGLHTENITAFTADLKWTSEVGSYEVRYGEHTGTPETLKYDNGTLATTIGTGSNTEFYWAAMYPAGTFTGNYLSKVTAYDCNSMTGSLSIYQGGTTAPETMIAEKAIEFTDADEFVDFAFDQLVALDVTKNLWIVLYNESAEVYPAAACNSTENNNQWMSFDGSTWYDIDDFSLTGYGWMIRANIETISLTGTGISWTDNTYPLTGLTQKTKYAAQVRNVCGGIDGESAWATTLFSTTASCVAPEGLAISGEVTAREASFTWTADEVTFQYCVIANPAPGYTPIDKEFNHETTGNTATCVELTPDTDYVFYLRKKCSDTDFSEIVSIAFRTELACYAPESLTVDDIATYSATLNWTGTDGDYDVRYGLYPTSTAQEWLTYGITQSSNLGSSTASLRTWGVKYESSEITGNFLTQIEIPYVPGYNSNDYIILAVYSGGDNAPRNLLSTEVLYPEIDGMNTITLANPVAIPSGQNLWITLSEYGTYVVPFGASTEENAQWYFNGTEWTLWPYMVSNEYGCVINGYMETLDIDNVEWTNATSTTGSYPMSGLTASTQYMAQVRHNCGGEDGESIWWTAQFTTDVACPVPTDLVASDITGHEATLSWTGDTDANYNVAYRTSAYFDGLYEEFTTTSAPSGWTKLSGAFLNDDGTTSATSTTGGWSFNTNKFSSIHAYMNMYSNWKYWLITPSIEIAAGCSFSFDVAYTAYNSTSAAGTTGTDDKFCVLISTDEKAHWTILREWNNDGTGDAVLNDIPTTFQTISDIDLSAYKGQTVYIAFYGGSTESNTDNTLRIDNVMVGTPVAAGAWQETTAKTNSKQLNGLLAETKYDAKVQKDCDPLGASDWSDIISFTTDIACYPATGLAYDNVKSNRVDLTWTSEADAWVFAYKLATDADFTEIALTSSDVTIEGTTVTYQLTGLTAEKEYAVKVRNNCGGGDLSAWTNVITFETLAACAQPTDVTVSNIGHYTADVAWTGDSDSFTVKYRTASGVNAILTEGFEDETLFNDNWTVVNYSTENASRIGRNTDAAHTGSYGFRFSSWSNATTYEEHLINKNELTGLTNGVIEFYYKMSNSGYTETFKVGYSSTDNETTSFTFGDNHTATTSWQLFHEAIPAGTKYVSIQYTTTGCYYYIYIDDIVIGNTTDPGAWQTVNSTTTTANLEGLIPGTKYELAVVPSCDETLESDMVEFTTVSGDYKYFLTEGNWNVDASWEPVGVPTSLQDVELFANATIPSGCVAEARNVYGYSTYTLTIEDGGQLKHNNSSVRATVKKNITGYGEGNANWYLISNPLYQTIYKHTSSYTPNISSTGIIDGDYDLYNWDNTEDYEWRNYKTDEFANAFNLNYTLYGYLYANKTGVELSITGTVRASSDNVSRYLTDYSSSYELGGWYLLGNPFVCDAYLIDASTEGKALPYYKMNDAGDEFEAVTNGAPIAPMTGIFYETTTSGNVRMTRTAPTPAEGKGNLNIMLAQNVSSRDAVASTDNAIVRFDGGQQLSKLSLRENSTKMYIPQDSKKYAVVSAEASGTLPLNLKVEKTGSYTISFSNEDVEFAYLHLIDGITGEDIDLLVEDSYTFNASVRDRENRFTLVFNSIDSNIDATSDIFVYQNDDQIVVSGEGELQVYDVMGRYVGSYNVNGTETLNASQFANNVYIFRLVGETVKTQKIVVR